MKAKNIVTILFAVIISLAIGFILGVALTNPGMNFTEATGTIGRVDQYRHVQITSADIELRNEMLADAHMREAYRNYLAYEYSANVKMADDVRFALEAGRSAPGFAVANARTLDRMEAYAEFLDNARLRVLQALGTINDLSGRDRVAIRGVLNSAGNAISQTIIRSNVVFDYLTGAEKFFVEAPKSEFPDIVSAHDQLFANLLMSNMVNDNRPVLEHLLAKNFLDEDGELAQLDRESLQIIVPNDAARLNMDVGLFDVEMLQQVLFDSEQLQRIIAFDSEQLQFYVDSEQLQAIWDSEQLQVFDSEQLNSVLRGAEQMQDQILMDIETLNMF